MYTSRAESHRACTLAKEPGKPAQQVSTKEMYCVLTSFPADTLKLRRGAERWMVGDWKACPEDLFQIFPASGTLEP